MINQTSSNVERVIEILESLSQILFSGEDITESLTASEITKVIRHLEDKNPGMAGLIRDYQGQFSKRDKFAIRQILLGMACAIASSLAGEKKPRKLHKLGR